MHTIINCAMSADGKIALPTRIQTRISSEEDLKRVHELRSRADAILVGVETILADNPSLKVSPRYVLHERQPLRIVLDSRGRTPEGAAVLDGSAPTLIVTNEACTREFPPAETLRCGTGRIDLPKLLASLEARGVRMLLVEGGSTVIWSFLHGRLADELWIYIGPIVIGGRESPTPAAGQGAKSLEEAVKLELLSADRLGPGLLIGYRVIK